MSCDHGDSGDLFRSVSSVFISGNFLFVPPCSFVSFVIQAFGLCQVIVLSSSTSSGHSGQLCFQHTIKSAPSTGCPCTRKFLLSHSSSIFFGTHRSGSISYI